MNMVRTFLLPSTAASIALLLAAGGAHAFSPSSRYSAPPRPFRLATATDVSAETSPPLSPESTAVMDGVIGKVMAGLPEEGKDGGMRENLDHFIREYFTACDLAGVPPESIAEKIGSAIKFGMEYGSGPNKYTFGVSHDAIREPFDYYKWGCDFWSPTMDLENSVVLGKENLEIAFQQIRDGENVVFLANHQSEADPQVFSSMLAKAGFGEEAEHIRYLAGHKVTTDTLAVPFSMGRNLLCIHSKKHIDSDPDTKSGKQRQNLATMSAMLKMLRAGGTSLWVAPSGGRDRRDTQPRTAGTPPVIPVAPFDTKTVDMFRLLGNKSKVPTHFYPLAMVSYELCPPPDTTEAAVGEQRNVRFSPVGISVGPEVPNVGGLEARNAFTDDAMDAVQKGYAACVEEIREKVPFRCADE